jgi:hypothetical protein
MLLTSDNNEMVWPAKMNGVTETGSRLKLFCDHSSDFNRFFEVI